MKEDFFEKLTIDDLYSISKDVGDIAKLCGTEVAIRLLEHFPGTSVYVPKEGVVLLKKDYIRKNFNGKNSRELALETGYSQVHVYRILKEGKKDALDGQMDMFAEPGEKDIEITEGGGEDNE